MCWTPSVIWTPFTAPRPHEKYGSGQLAAGAPPPCGPPNGSANVTSNEVVVQAADAALAPSAAVTARPARTTKNRRMVLPFRIDCFLRARPYHPQAESYVFADPGRSLHGDRVAVLAPNLVSVRHRVILRLPTPSYAARRSRRPVARRPRGAARK